MVSELTLLASVSQLAAWVSTGTSRSPPCRQRRHVCACWLWLHQVPLESSVSRLVAPLDTDLRVVQIHGEALLDPSLLYAVREFLRTSG